MTGLTTSESIQIALSSVMIVVTSVHSRRTCSTQNHQLSVELLSSCRSVFGDGSC